MDGLRKIDCVMFRVVDLEASASFFEGVMGLRRAWTDTENNMIGFLFPENNSELVIHMDPSLPNPSQSFSVDDVEEFCRSYREKGYKVLIEPFEVRCGLYAVLLDPDGNRLEIIDLTKFGGVPQYGD
ncbi:VOC family protein [Candidatus Bathyarchaeota archaeon]|nr:VOC family protein [Candidatus Bathyarchaeota archaeon]MCK4703111.1 VOC family protein [Candidatus Bathyarchaeota archaeon]